MGAERLGDLLMTPAQQQVILLVELCCIYKLMLRMKVSFPTPLLPSALQVPVSPGWLTACEGRVNELAGFFDLNDHSNMLWALQKLRRWVKQRRGLQLSRSKRLAGPRRRKGDGGKRRKSTEAVAAIEGGS